jgi:tRNA-specific 2-thiouridylase
MADVIAIAMSGGIDSLVSAALLKERGHQVLAVHFLTGYEPGELMDRVSDRFQSTAPPDDIPPDDIPIDTTDQAHSTLTPLADQLNIPLHIIDLRKEFKSIVVDYFIHTYGQGKTPNPCLLCNQLIKFDILYRHTKTLGADWIATGHYARNIVGSDARRHLLRGLDPNKDQSYFLARLTQEQLNRAVFPLAEFTKDQTRKFASDRGLQPVTTRESQDICFINNGSYGDFLTRQPGFQPRPGPIEDIQGRVIGQHNGLHLFTIGQRRGINCPAAQPYYVVRIDARRNCLVVGFKEHLSTPRCRVEQINWICPLPPEPLDVSVKVRYRHTAVPVTLTPLAESSAEIVFQRPEPAVTPGQGAVFYQGNEVLGGGWIQ